MNIFSIILFSLKKSNKIKKLYKKLYGNYNNLNMEERLQIFKDSTDFDKDKEIQNKALDDLIILIQNDISLKQIVEEYNVNEKLLHEIYDRFCGLGFKRYYAGHLLPAAAISYASSLKYILSNYNDFSGGENQATIVNNVILYFKDGVQPTLPQSAK